MEENKILQKLEQQDKKFEQHDQQFIKIDEHFGVIEKKLDQHDQQFVKIDERFDKVEHRLDHHDKQFEAIIGKLMEHDEKLDNMVTKDEFFELKDKLLQGQDEIITIVKRLDEERLSTISRIDRIEDEVGIHGTEINQIKVQLNIP